MDRQAYVDQIVSRLHAMLVAETRLPCAFSISGGQTTQTDFPITVFLEPSAPCAGVYETAHVFADLQRKLNDDFRGEPLYFGIHIGVPHRFLGQLHLSEVEAQNNRQVEDNKQFRRIRLKDEQSTGDG